MATKEREEIIIVIIIIIRRRRRRRRRRMNTYEAHKSKKVLLALYMQKYPHTPIDTYRKTK